MRAFNGLLIALALVFIALVSVTLARAQSPSDVLAKFATDDFSDTAEAIDALPGITAPNLTGGTSTMLPNHHITKPVFIGEIKGDGQFSVVWKTPGLVPGDAWSDFLPGSKDLEADWVKLKCGNYNKVTKKCGGQAS